MSQVSDEAERHRSLVGKSGSRLELDTPVLVLEYDALARNILRLASFATVHGVRLRPHVKTHKSVDIAKMQHAAGAVGFCCAKLGEAEVFAARGFRDLLITSPVVTEAGLRRLRALAEQCPNLKIVVDHPDNVSALSGVMGLGKLEVLIDIDPGIHRTGVASPGAAAELFERIVATSNLVYGGVQYYCGLQQHIERLNERRAAMLERTDYLTEVLTALSQRGAVSRLISGGGTGTHMIDAEFGVLNEWQVGSYAVMDRQYALCDLGVSAPDALEHALFVDTRVVSINTPGVATVDAGFKSLSTDGGSPAFMHGASNTAMFIFAGDEHGCVVDHDRSRPWQLGERVCLAPPHCDPTVNLFDAYHVVRGDTLIDIWPVSARGRSR